LSIPKNFQEKWVGNNGYKEFAPGLTHCYIDGIEVEKAEFESKIKIVQYVAQSMEVNNGKI